MVNALKLSEGAILALHTALLLAKEQGRPISSEAAAEKMGFSFTHLSKVLQSLGKAGLVRATRGPNGGYLLNHPPSEIRLREVLEAVEGPMRLSKCLFSSPRCASNDYRCMLGDLLETINSEVLQQLEKRLSEFCV